MKSIQHAIVALAASAAALFAVGAHADSLYSAGNSGALETPGSLDASFSAGAGAGLVTLQLQGYNSLDGDNYYIDIFHVSVNGSEVFSATFGLGGGGADRILVNPYEIGFTHNGNMIDLAIPVNFADGANTVSFSYESPTSFEGTGRAGYQGMGDEGWGLNSVEITGNGAAPAVPEPETYAMLLAGLGVIGFMSRRRAAAR